MNKRVDFGSDNGSENEEVAGSLARRLSERFVEDLQANPDRVIRLLAATITVMAKDISKFKDIEIGEAGGPYLVEGIKEALDLDKMIASLPELPIPAEALKEMVASAIAMALCLAIKDLT